MNSASNRRRQAGVTLIELMVTVAVAAILLAIAVPSFTAFVISNRLNTQINELVTGLQTARSEAIRLNTTVIFCRAANPQSTTCAGGSPGTDAWEHWVIVAPALSNPLIRSGSVNTAGGISLRVSPNIATNQITFRSDSLARRAGTEVFLSGTLRICAPVASPTENARDIDIRGGGRPIVIRRNLGAAGCITNIPNPA